MEANGRVGHLYGQSIMTSGPERKQSLSWKLQKLDFKILEEYIEIKG